MMQIERETIFLVCVFMICLGVVAALVTRQDNVRYFATFENGTVKQVDGIVTFPIWSVEQIDRMWPEYYAETKVNVGGKEIILRSNPFLFCDNPELEGSYAGRDVYCPLKGNGNPQ
jgi:hypothetical protein